MDHINDRLVPDGSPTTFVTEHDSHMIVHQIQSGLGQPCFDVWMPDSTFYEFGCTADSLQYHTDSAGTRTNYRWDLDRMTPPNEGPGTSNQYLDVSYEQDKVTTSGHTTIRDAVLKQIVYGTNGTGGQVAGTVDFSYKAPFNDGTWASAYGTNYNCASSPPINTTLRCDDPLDLSGGLSSAAVKSTFSLSSVTSYVGDDSSATHKEASYAFSYQDNPFVQVWDDFTQIQEYAAGSHLLQSVTPTMYLDGTAHALKPLLLSYSSPLRNGYYDSTQKIQDGTQQYMQQTFWRYLTKYVDTTTGVGATITYQEAYGNTHGTPNDSGDDRFDPLHCSIYTDCTGPSAHPDDRQWGQQVVTSITTLGKDSSASGLTNATTTYHYRLMQVSSDPTFCPSRSQGDTDACVNDNWIPVNGSIHDTDWADFYHAEFRGFNVVDTTSPAGDLTADTYAVTDGWFTPAGFSSNYTAGSLYQEDIYRGNSASGPLLQETVNTYAGNNGTANACLGRDSQTYTPCFILLLSSKTTDYEGTTLPNPNAPWKLETNTYDGYDSTNGIAGGYQNLQTQQISSSNAPTVTKKWTYQPVNTVIGGWQYYNVQTPVHSELDDSSGHVWQCENTTYDEGAASGVPTPDAGLATTTKDYSNCANQTGTAITTYQGYTTNGNQVASVDGVGTANASFYSSAGCTPATTPSIKPSAWTATKYTTCTSYDTLGARPLVQTNALNQSTSMVYDDTQEGLPISASDLNSQLTSVAYAYDSNGNPIVNVSLPGETGSYTKRATSASTCTASSSLPCYEVDTNSSLYASAISRTFSDSLGRQIETRTPGPGSGDDTIVFTVYNDQNHSSFQSSPFEVASGSGWVDPNTAKDINNHTPGGTATFLDALDRTLATQDPSFGSTQEPGLSCSATLTGKYTSCTNYGLGSAHGDTATYLYAQSIDPNNHMTVSFTDSLDRTRYDQQYSGFASLAAGAITSNIVQQQASQYNALDKATSVTVTDLAPQAGQTITSVTTTAQYDDLGRLTQLADPDRGTHTYTYDANDQMLTDISGTRTLGYNNDLLGRVGCIQDIVPVLNATGACTSGSHPYVQNTYDTTKLGTQGASDFPVGQLTQSISTTTYTDSSQTSVTEQYQHDQRGRLTTQTLHLSMPGSWGVSTPIPDYQKAVSYNDADQPTTTATSTIPSGQGGATFTQVYDGTTGTPTGLSNNTFASADLATLSYNANAQLGAINFLTVTSHALATEQFGYDANLRPTTTLASWQSGSGSAGTLLSHTRTYDNAGNVTSVNEALSAANGVLGSGGSETQVFCYDEENRLVWSGNSGTVPSAGNGTCGSGTPGSTISGASYLNSFVYTHLGQQWQAPVNGGSFQNQDVYCDSSHPHQLTGLYPLGTTCANKSGAVYTSSYDAWGNVTSRMDNGITTTLSYDGQDHLTQTSASTLSEWYAYDASGQRVLRRTSGSGGTQIITSVFGMQDSTYNGNGAKINAVYYYSLAGRLIGRVEGGAINYFITDELGTPLTNISAGDGSAVVNGNQLYGPYGNQRTLQGWLGTSRGFTGQYGDATGLDYYSARYYDPGAGIFLSADTVQDNMQGMDPYSYVGGNPETVDDPSGHDPSIQNISSDMDPDQILELIEEAAANGPSLVATIMLYFAIISGSGAPNVPIPLFINIVKMYRQIDTTDGSETKSGGLRQKNNQLSPRKGKGDGGQSFPQGKGKSSPKPISPVSSTPIKGKSGSAGWRSRYQSVAVRARLAAGMRFDQQPNPVPVYGHSMGGPASTFLWGLNPTYGGYGDAPAPAPVAAPQVSWWDEFTGWFRGPATSQPGLCGCGDPLDSPVDEDLFD